MTGSITGNEPDFRPGGGAAARTSGATFSMPFLIHDVSVGSGPVLELDCSLAG